MKTEINISQVKSLQLDILKEIHKFCCCNGIKYSLAYGTLLGAIRHRGYIPWDDDIDIWMYRKDYNKFMSSFCSDRYKQTYKYGDTNIMLPFGKVYDSKTTLIENANHSISQGVYIDIFPIDKKSDVNYQRIRKKVNLLYKIKTIKEIRFSKRRSCKRNFILACLKTVTYPISYKIVLKSLSHLFLSSSNEPSKELIDYNEYNRMIVFDKNCFNALIELPFEDTTFYAFRDFDEILTHAYGNYMQLPPKAMQVTHHDFKAYYK